MCSLLKKAIYTIKEDNSKHIFFSELCLFFELDFIKHPTAKYWHPHVVLLFCHIVSDFINIWHVLFQLKNVWILIKSFFYQVTTRSLKRWSGSNMEFDKSGSMKRLNFNNLTDVAVEEHPDLHTSEYMVLLGDSRYYYQFQFTNEFPQDAAFEGRGVERYELLFL